MRTVSSWGRLSNEPHNLVRLADARQIEAQLASTAPGIAFGNGRSYGDACLNPHGTLWDTRGMDRFIKLDRVTGRLICEAGVLLRDIQRAVIPLGWVLPVTPGTQLITVGGAIANDVHGKNHHHMGSFGNHVLSIVLLRTDGEKIICGPDDRPDWFAATVGGLGLTGVMLQAEIQLRPVAGPWIQSETIPFDGLSEFFRLSDRLSNDSEYTVSWIDCLSGANMRGLFMHGNFAVQQTKETPRDRRRSIPIVPPFSLINRMTLKPFNSAYFCLKQASKGPGLSHYEAFFYPLDDLLHWNRIYGPRGFFQYQSVVPAPVAKDATEAMLKTIAKSGQGSFLTVLKTFGERSSVGMLSFPMSGLTLALDFPNKGEPTLRLLERLDAIVREAGGRIYAAKDARMPRDLWESGYPRLVEFTFYRDPGISSGLSRRLMGS